MNNFSFSFKPLLILKTIFISALIFLLLAGCGKKKYADIVLLNGYVATMNDDNPKVEAVAVKGDTVWEVGSNDKIKSLVGDKTKVIDLEGNFVMPGFIESHAHLLSLGKSKMMLNLNNAKTWQEIVLMVAQAAEKTKPGNWIVGRGWHQEKWNPPPTPNVNGYPVHDYLSNASPNNPVLLTHASGHALFANAKAMQLAGITDSTEDPPGGTIIRDSNGKAIGVFEETAEDLIQNEYSRFLDKKSDEEKTREKIEAIRIASIECLSKGITTFHDAGSSFKTIDLFKQLADSSKLGLRLYVMIGESNKSLKKHVKDYKIIGYENNHLTVRAIKKYVDGALGSRGAWMLEPYSDLPGYSGLNVTPLSELRKTAKIAAQNGFQMCTHSIGDRGNREMLNIYEKVMKDYPDTTDFRWRIEHAQHISEKDLPRFAKLKIIAAMQGIHCTSDAVFVAKRLGDYRAREESYVWRKLIDEGVTICNGTDAPVEDVSPINCFYSSVTRRLNDGSVFYPDEKMTREEALKSYTINGAYAAFEENIKGTIEPGKLADFVVLSNNLLEVPDNKIKSTKVIYTIVGGEVLYQNIK